MSVAITLEKKRKTCTSGRKAFDYRLDPGPDNNTLIQLMKKGPVSTSEIGPYLVFRIEWNEEISIKGMIDDPIITVTCSKAKEGDIPDYLNQVFS